LSTGWRLGNPSSASSSFERLENSDGDIANSCAVSASDRSRVPTGAYGRETSHFRVTAGPAATPAHLDLAGQPRRHTAAASHDATARLPFATLVAPLREGYGSSENVSRQAFAGFWLAGHVCPASVPRTVPVQDAKISVLQGHSLVVSRYCPIHCPALGLTVPASRTLGCGTVGQRLFGGRSCAPRSGLAEGALDGRLRYVEFLGDLPD
jgi:hypothetical protein